MDRDRHGRRIVYPPIHRFIDEWGNIAYRVELSNGTATIIVDRLGDTLSPEEALEMVKEDLRDGLEEGIYLPCDFYPPDDRRTGSMNMQPPIIYAAAAAAAMGGRRLEEWEEAYSGKIPASAEAVAALPETRVEEGECSVCLMGFDTSSKIRAMPCSHYFHEHCIFTWLRLNHVCPLCRFPLPTEKHE